MGYFEIGIVVNTQGIKGEVRVISTTDDPGKFKKLESVELYLKGEVKEYRIESARNHKQFIVLKFAGIEDINSATMLRGAVLRIPESLGVPLGEDEYYIKDIYDMAVVAESGEKLGIISDIIFTGANDVYVVRNPGERDLLIPAIKQCVINVDVENKVMTVRLLEGLRD